MAQGLYLQVKAYMAKKLLQRAWERTLKTGQQSKPWPWAESWPIARIRVADKQIDMIVLSGDCHLNMDFGPGYCFGSTMINGSDNAVIKAHRDTFLQNMAGLSAGDVLNIQAPGGEEHRFSVADTQVIDEEASIILDARSPMLTLVTPYPFDDDAQVGHLRYLLFAVREPNRVI